jgi:hypothetical protein
MPQSQDNEGNPVFVLFEPALPKFITYQNGLFLCFPKDPKTDINMFQIKGYLTDTKLRTYFQFQLEVTNQAPQFSAKILDKLVMIFTEVQFTLPSSSDLENMPYKITATG